MASDWKLYASSLGLSNVSPSAARKKSTLPFATGEVVSRAMRQSPDELRDAGVIDLPASASRKVPRLPAAW